MSQERCHGAGEIEVGTVQDEFGNWDTETHECPGCSDCVPSDRWKIIQCPDCGAIRTDGEPAHRSMCILNGQAFERYGNWVEVVPARALEAALEEARRYRETLEYLASEDNWTLEAGMDRPAQERLPLLYGHDQPWELARSALVSGGRE